jgi:glutathione synthase/RimK-type ligase-like ATP-grasp enzyme
MRILIVVDSPRDWPLHFEGADVVAAREYITDPGYSELGSAKVFNLCRSYRYQSLGYYVSLLASARGHKPFPDVIAIQDMKTHSIIRVASEELDALIQKSMAPIQSQEFVLSIYFGHNLAKRHDPLSQHLFKLFPLPFLRAQFERRKKGHWFLKSIGPIAASEIPDEHRSFVLEVAKEFFSRAAPRRRRAAAFRYDLAILRNPEEKEPPSEPKALRKFVKAAEALGMETELIEKEDYARLAEFDALFIRETTNVNHHTYRFARRAAAEGLVVVDDPESILKCTNKVFLAELLMKNRIPVPDTVILQRENAENAAGLLGFPLILKRPDSSFSQGVVKVESREELASHVRVMLERSDLIIAQKFVPTEYDWRVGIFDRRVLFVCKYYMAGGHWQIIKRDTEGLKTGEGMSEAVPVDDAPKAIVRTALRAANLIGDGFYGVDLKQSGKDVHVIEVNDNPNVDTGVEDVVLRDELYRQVMRVILGRIERKKGR